MVVPPESDKTRLPARVTSPLDWSTMKLAPPTVRLAVVTSRPLVASTLPAKVIWPVPVVIAWLLVVFKDKVPVESISKVPAVLICEFWLRLKTPVLPMVNTGTPEADAVKIAWSPVSLKIERDLPVTAPDKSSLATGVVLPMPTLPAASINIALKVFTLNNIFDPPLPADCTNKAFLLATTPPPVQ